MPAPRLRNALPEQPGHFVSRLVAEPANVGHKHFVHRVRNLIVHFPASCQAGADCQRLRFDNPAGDMGADDASFRLMLK